jgi:hypothetical protein
MGRTISRVLTEAVTERRRFGVTKISCSTASRAHLR